jgi:hypothetical protein
MSLQSDIFEEKLKRGRKSIASKHPEAVQEARELVKECGLEADLKKGSETPYVYGTTHAMVRNHVSNEFPEIKSENPKFSTSMDFDSI